MTPRSHAIRTAKTRLECAPGTRTLDPPYWPSANRGIVSPSHPPLSLSAYRPNLERDSGAGEPAFLAPIGPAAYGIIRGISPLGSQEPCWPAGGCRWLYPPRKSSVSTQTEIRERGTWPLSRDGGVSPMRARHIRRKCSVPILRQQVLLARSANPRLRRRRSSQGSPTCRLLVSRNCTFQA